MVFDMVEENWIQIQPMKSGFKIYKTLSSVVFVYFLNDNEFGWVKGQVFSLPIELAQKVLKPEFLEDKKDKEESK